jgi:hypothetical protein
LLKSTHLFDAIAVAFGDRENLREIRARELSVLNKAARNEIHWREVARLLSAYAMRRVSRSAPQVENPRKKISPYLGFTEGRNV